MAQVRMLQGIGGFRNGAEWPPIGGEIELPDAEASDMARAGYAELVDYPADPAPVARKRVK